jgi:hypothetical protein
VEAENIDAVLYSLKRGKEHFSLNVLIRNKRESTEINLYNSKKILQNTGNLNPNPS